MPKSKMFLLGENIVQKLHNIGFGNDFLNMTPKVQVIKDKTYKLDSMQSFKFCTFKDTIHGTKR